MEWVGDKGGGHYNGSGNVNRGLDPYSFASGTDLERGRDILGVVENKYLNEKFSLGPVMILNLHLAEVIR